MADAYRLAASRSRRGQISGHLLTVSRGVTLTSTRFTADFFSSADPIDDAKQQYIAWQNQMISALEEIKCLDAEAAGEPATRVSARNTEIKVLLDAETACRSSAPCLGGRAASQLCQLIPNRAAAAADIAKERANPGGVVDLQKLHDLGQNVQDFDAAIAKWKTSYASLLHKPFTMAACSPLGHP